MRRTILGRVPENTEMGHPPKTAIRVAVLSVFLTLSCADQNSVTPDTTDMTVSVTPEATTVEVDGTQQFSASVTGTTNTGVTWSVDGDATFGTITSTGLFTAPASLPDPATATVRATSTANTQLSATATVTLMEASNISVSVTPQAAWVEIGGTQQFSADVAGTTNTEVTWSVDEGATFGTITSTGLFTAPASLPNPATATVRATSAANTQISGTATVSLTGTTVTVMVDAVQNIVGDKAGDGDAVSIALPGGSANLTIQASGSAYYAPGKSFAMLVFQHREGSTTVFQRAIPIGGETQLEISETSRGLDFFFVDSDPTDNSGTVTITVSGTVSATTSVSPIDNCLTDPSAASTILKNAACVVSATGNPSWGAGQYATVLLMYHDSLGARAFLGVEIGASPTPVPFFDGGEVRLFHADSFAGDNGGSAEVIFECTGTPASQHGDLR